MCDILKNKKKWLEVNNLDANKQKDRSPKFLQLEEAFVIWITQALATNRVITSEIILSKANDYTKLLNIENFHELED